MEKYGNFEKSPKSGEFRKNLKYAFLGVFNSTLLVSIVVKLKFNILKSLQEWRFIENQGNSMDLRFSGILLNYTIKLYSFKYFSNFFKTIFWQNMVV